MRRSRWWASAPWIPLAILVGAAWGVAVYTISYAEGLSYLDPNPKACANCHLMNDVFDSWRKGPHHAVATCNDCHVPARFPQNYIAKAVNGYHHSIGMTFQPSRPDEPGAILVFREPITIKPANSRILQRNCLGCHRGLVHGLVGQEDAVDGDLRCVHCHAAVGHGAKR